LEDGIEMARAMGAPFPLARCLSLLANVARSEGDLGWRGQVGRGSVVLICA